MSTSDRRALRLAATRLREQAEWAADHFRSGGKWESEYSYMRREYNRDLRLAARLERMALPEPDGRP